MQRVVPNLIVLFHTMNIKSPSFISFVATQCLPTRLFFLTEILSPILKGTNFLLNFNTFSITLQ